MLSVLAVSCLSALSLRYSDGEAGATVRMARLNGAISEITGAASELDKLQRTLRRITVQSVVGEVLAKHSQA